MYCDSTSRTDLYHLFMASTPIISRFEYEYIFTLIFRSGDSCTTYFILSRGASHSTITDRIYSIRQSNDYLLLGIFVFKETFDIHQFITFIFIWIGIALYSISQYIKMKRSPRPNKNKPPLTA